jgi:hypothetical protein
MELPITMDNVGHLPAARRVGSTKARRGRPPEDCARDENVVQEPPAVETAAAKTAAVETAAVGTAAVGTVAIETVAVEAGAVEPVADETVTRERSLLLATLRVWELKHGISE